MKVVLFLVLVGAMLLLCYAQSDCSPVEDGLEIIFEPCGNSVKECIMAKDLTGLSAIFCSDDARMLYEDFLRCSGQTFSNLVFGALCGGTSCTGVNGTCVSGDQKCFESVLDSNNASEVFENCMCASQALANGCPDSTCTSALQELVNDVGCCANSLLYSIYLDNCVESDSNIFSMNGLTTLFEDCNVTLPSSCPHPFLLPNSSQQNAMRETSVMWLILLSLLLL